MPKKPTNPILRALGVKMDERRKALGLSHEVLAYRSGISRQYISQLLAGKRNPGIINVVVIAQALEMKPEMLLEGVDA